MDTDTMNGNHVTQHADQGSPMERADKISDELKVALKKREDAETAHTKARKAVGEIEARAARLKDEAAGLPPRQRDYILAALREASTRGRKAKG